MGKKNKNSANNNVEAYRHEKETHKNVVPAGLASYDTLISKPKKYEYDPYLDKKDSQIVEQKIQQLKKELRSVQEEQSIVRNQIKDWIELDSFTMMIDGQKITAQQAAKECSENERNHSWFPDKLSQNDEPPLTEQELIEMCNFLKEISPADRKSCLQYLPDPKHLQSPEDFSNIVSELKSHKAFSAETEELRNDWYNNLHNADRSEIEKAIVLLEETLRSLEEFKYPWQFKALEFMASETVQDNYWRDFYNKSNSYRDKAWQSYRASQGYEVVVDNLPADMDINTALEELGRHVEKGKNPSSFFVRIRLSKAAKLLYQSIKVDGASLNSSEKINAIKAYFKYKNFLNKIDTLWKQTISSVNGPELDLACAMPLSEIDEKIKAVYCPMKWKDKFLKNNKTALSNLGCRKQILHQQKALEEYLKTLHGQIAEIEKRKIEHDLSSYQDRLRNESKKDNSHNLWRMIADAVGNMSPEQYQEAYGELMRLVQLSKKVEKLESLTSRLKNAVPLWYVSLEKKAITDGSDAIEKDWSLAWRWRRLNEWLIKLHSRESVESLQTRLERARRKERELIGELVVERTWQRQIVKVEDSHYLALIAWANAMRRYGKTGAKYPLYTIRKTYVEPELDLQKKNFQREYIGKETAGELSETIVAKQISSDKDEKEIEKIIKPYINYNIEHIFPVLIYRVRKLFNKSSTPEKIDFIVPENKRPDFFRALIEAIYKKYIETKFGGLPSSLTTFARSKDFYKAGEEAYIALKNAYHLEESDFVEKGKYHIE